MLELLCTLIFMDDPALPTKIDYMYLFLVSPFSKFDEGCFPLFIIHYFQIPKIATLFYPDGRKVFLSIFSSQKMHNNFTEMIFSLNDIFIDFQCYFIAFGSRFEHDRIQENDSGGINYKNKKNFFLHKIMKF